jgi:iron complex outermembrane receptor protein
MEFVEVFKGPHSLRYGSSFGGTINFVSASSKFSEVTSTYGRISSSTESNGGIFRTEGLFGLNGINYDFGLFGSFSKGGNYEDGDGAEIMSNFQRASFGLNLGVKLSDRQQLKISATYNLAQDTDFPSLPMDLISDKTTLLNLQHKINLEGKYLKSWNSIIYGTFVDHLMDNYGKVIIPRMIDAKTDAETISFGGRSEGSWYFENGGLYTGLDLRVEKADGIRFREFLMGPNIGKIVKDNVWNGGQISKAGLFAEYYHFYSAFQFIFSGRVEFNKAVANDINENFASKNSVLEKNDINPSFSIGGLMNLNENMTLGLWLGRAQRSGSLTERYINSFPVGLDPYDMLGNPDLKPEINNQADLTLDYKSQKTVIDLSLFAAILKDYISSEIDPNLNPTMPSSPGVRQFTNIADAFMTGFEVSWSQSLYTNLQHEFNLAYTYGKDIVREEPLPEIAPLDLRYSLIGNYFYNKLRPEISIRHVIRQNRISNIFGEVKTPAFTIVDLSLRYQFNKVIGVTFGVQNLLNELYYEHLSRAIRETKSPIYSPGRNLYLSLIVDLL